MGRNRRPAVTQHQHCEKCVNRYCNAPPVKMSASCPVINCHLYCGAMFHMCKEEEHQLLCPNEVVPCLNAEYGCPFTMSRAKLGQHLTVCPASVLSCSMDWNRWPAEDSSTALHENLLQEPISESQLDFSTALRDQKHLFSSLKMETFFAELVEKSKGSTCSELEGAVGGSAAGNDYGPLGDQSAYQFVEEEEEGLTQEEREALAKDRTAFDIEKYNIWEKMFSMARSGCEHTIQSLGKSGEHGPGKQKPLSRSQTLFEEASEGSQMEENTKPADVVKSGNNPGQHMMGGNVGDKAKSIYEKRPRQQADSAGQLGKFTSCQLKGKHFEYGYVEPMKIKMVRTFKIPLSYRAKHGRIRNPHLHKKVSKCVDTSDLDISMEDIPKWDEIQATLLCCMEKEFRGHLICKSMSTDTLLCDLGTQTYDFHSAPFKSDASLADVTADWPLKLHVQIHTEGVTNKHNKSCSAFTFLCGHCFRRDEFASHFRNVHTDIQSGLNGWFEERCPLAYLGCTYSQKRFHPSTHRATVAYNQELSTFTLRPEVSTQLFEGVKTIKAERKRARNVDALSRLPFEVLVHIAGFLDSFTLSQLALVSRLMRDICATLLPERGMVSLKWEKKTYSHGRSCWKAKKKVWQFSSLFSTVERWSFSTAPSMSEHLKLCPFYHTESRREPVALPSLCYKDQKLRKRQTLVSVFL